MESNGWTYYDRVHLDGPEWGSVLDALRDAAAGARAVSKGWPMREIAEHAVLVLEGDKHVPVATLAAGLRQAKTNPKIVGVRFDLYQGGAEDPRELEYMKIRACQLTARRDSGVTLYACSPNESEVAQLLAALHQPARRALAELPRWRRWLGDANKVVTHPIVAGIALAALAALWRLLR